MVILDELKYEGTYYSGGDCFAKYKYLFDELYNWFVSDKPDYFSFLERYGYSHSIGSLYTYLRIGKGYTEDGIINALFEYLPDKYFVAYIETEEDEFWKVYKWKE